jgi:hypothetical protein
MSERRIESKQTFTGSAETLLAASIWSSNNRAAFANLSRGYGDTNKGLIHEAGVSIEPCTPPGMDPLKDPANPKAPNYDAGTFGPGPPKPLFPNDGVITPGQLELRKKLGTSEIYQPQYGRYSGACKVYPDKDEDLSKFPMS